MPQIPILIPARNEAGTIATTLRALGEQDVEPIVLANGCQDNTAAIATEFGADVLVLPEASKVQALQAGMRHLGERALDPLIILDADTYPLSKRWSSVMGRLALKTEAPVVACGSTLWRDGPSRFTDLAYGVRSYSKQSQQVRAAVGGQYGPNTLLALRKQALLDKFMELQPNLWNGEDRAIRDLVIAEGGVEIPIWDPRSLVSTDGAHHISISQRLLVGKQQARQIAAAHHSDTAPPNAVAYVPEQRLNSPLLPSPASA